VLLGQVPLNAVLLGQVPLNAVLLPLTSWQLAFAAAVQCFATAVPVLRCIAVYKVWFLLCCSCCGYTA